MIINKKFTVRNGELRESYPLNNVVKIEKGKKVKGEFIFGLISLGVYYEWKSECKTKQYIHKRSS